MASVRRPFILAALLAIPAAFLAGRCTVPAPAQEVRTEERVVYRDRVVEREKRVEVRAEAKTRTVYRDREIRPDGTRLEREVEKTESASVSDLKLDREVRRDVEVRSEVRTETVILQPKWRLGLLAGTRLSLPPSLTYGLVVERHVFSGLYVGAWALRGPADGVAAGLSLSYSF